MRTWEFEIAGFWEGNREENLGALNVGDRITATRTPNNRHDRNANKLYGNGRVLGFVPAVLSAELAPLLDSGTPFRATLSAAHRARLDLFEPGEAVPPSAGPISCPETTEEPERAERGFPLLGAGFLGLLCFLLYLRLANP
jgi:hypothetical protein